MLREPRSFCLMIKKCLRSEEAVGDLSCLAWQLSAICLGEFVLCSAATGHRQDEWEWRKTHLVPLPLQRHSSLQLHTGAEVPLLIPWCLWTQTKGKTIEKDKLELIEGKNIFSWKFTCKARIIPYSSQKYEEQSCNVFFFDQNRKYFHKHL